MAKVSRPIIYAAVLGAVAYAAVVLTEPAAPAKKKKPRPTATPAAVASGVLPEDLKATFPRYASKRSGNVFRPLVVTARSLGNTGTPPAAKTPAIGATTGNWVLTGITAIDNVKRALVENSATGDSVFLKSGDRWNGYRVVGVGNVAVRLADGNGRETALLFPEPPDPSSPGTPTAPAPGTVPPAPVVFPNLTPGGQPTPNGSPRQIAVGQPGGPNGT
ncbi:MAG: hypothetical protein SFU56_02450 [Capsulimonadales bacterium]|nr:hypothetical protein [Capsulimonadales bacterium]